MSQAAARARAGWWKSGRQMNWINCSVTSNCQYLYQHQLERVAAETVKTIFTRSPFRKIFILKHPSFSSKKLNFNVVLNFKRLFLWCLLTLISQLLASFSMFDIRELNISMDGWWLSTISAGCKMSSRQSPQLRAVSAQSSRHHHALAQLTLLTDAQHSDVLIWSSKHWVQIMVKVNQTLVWKRPNRAILSWKAE